MRSFIDIPTVKTVMNIIYNLAVIIFIIKKQTTVIEPIPLTPTFIQAFLAPYNIYIYKSQ